MVLTVNSQLGRIRAQAREAERRRRLLLRARHVEHLVIRLLNALAQRGRSPRADLDVGQALCDLLDTEEVSVEEVVRLSGGELDAVEVRGLHALACPQSALTRTKTDH